MKIAYFDSFSGISGDMILGALVDLGVPLEEIIRELDKLNICGYRLRSKSVMRGAIGGTKVDVEIESTSYEHSRNLDDIIEIIQNSPLKEEIKDKGIKIFTRLGAAEASVHKKPVSQIHFHEVGAIDSIVDVMGSLIALDLLKVEKVFSSKITLGSFGFVHCDHGILPLPAPATLELLKGIPTTSVSINREITTPTGAAIISTLSSSFAILPDMRIQKIGYGAGSREDQEIPNMLRIIIGESEDEKEEDTFTIETNIDDMSPQFYDHIMEMLFDQGAIDVFITPVHMKKNRPGILLTVLSERKFLDKIIKTVLKETTSLGLRYYRVNRYKLQRYIEEVETPYGSVSVKISYNGEEILNIQPEYETCKKIALEYKIPLKKVYFEVWRSVCQKTDFTDIPT